MQSIMISDFVDVNGGKIYYEMAGEGEIVVLSHAGFVDSRMWDEQWEEFTKRYRVMRYDMPGYGKSDPVQGPVSRRDDLYRLLQKLGIDQAYMVGSSLGGEVMLDLTLEHPEMVKALVVVGSTPTGFEMQGEPPAEVLEMIDAMQKRDAARMSEMQIRLWIDGHFRQPEQVDPLVRQRTAEMNQIPVKNRTWSIADDEPANPLNPPALQRLDQIQVPTLVMAGALDNPEILRAADVMADSIKGARKAILPDSAHVPSMEKPAEFNQIVLEFLRSVG
jgi:pimeloyl-ACP methyl ester carboxylesterase